MQRAAAAQPNSPKEGPSTPTGPPTKRQRTSAASSPATPSDLEAVHAAIAAEELKRTQAIERAAAEAGETRWVLSFREPEKEARQHNALRVVSAGYADLDNEDEDDDEDEAPQVGRMTFGKKPAPPAKDEDSESDEESNSESGEDDDPATKMIREARREAAKERRNEKKKAQTEKMAQMAEERRKKKVKLNTLSSISGSGGSSGGLAGRSNIECYSCGKKGHAKKDCPNANKRRRD